MKDCLYVTEKEFKLIWELVEASKDCAFNYVGCGLDFYEYLFSASFNINGFNLDSYKECIEKDMLVFNSAPVFNYVKYYGRYFIRDTTVIYNQKAEDISKKKLEDEYKFLVNRVNFINKKAKSVFLDINISLDSIESYKDVINKDQTERAKAVKFYNKALDVFFGTFADKYAKRGVYKDQIHNDFYYQVVDILMVQTLESMRYYLDTHFQNAYVNVYDRIKLAKLNIYIYIYTLEQSMVKTLKNNINTNIKLVV